MARDRIKPDAFWTEALNRYRYQIQQYETMLENSASEEKRGRVCRAIFHSRFCYLVALYSAGASAEELRPAYDACLQTMAVIWSPDSSYVDMLWMVSLGVLLRASESQVRLLEAVYRAFGAEDSLISFLLHSLDGGVRLCDRMLFDVPYQTLLPITSMDRSAEPTWLLQEYLKQWYKGHDDTWWYNTHQTNTYVGYWCFEAAALVKILGLNEADFLDSRYFPG